MINVNDAHFEQAYFERWYSRFDAHPQLGRGSGERIAVCTSDTAFWLALCLYAKEHGLTVFPLPADTPLTAARRRADRGKCTSLLFGDSGETALERLESLGRDDAPAEARLPGLIQTSSGTTGEPKFIERSWVSIDHEISAYLEHFSQVHDSDPIIACPVTHSYGLISGVLASLARAKAPLVVANLNPKYLLRKAMSARNPLLYSSPTLVTTMTILAPTDCRNLSVVTSGSTLHKAWFNGIKSKVLHLHQQYGCSEAGCVSVGKDISAPNDLGEPLPHVRVKSGTAVTEPSEILVSLVDGKVIETRDLGYIHEERLHFVSRIDEMINVSGLNVYPAEVEEVVLQMPEIEDAVAFAGERALGHHQVCLRFTAKQTIAAERIRDWCSERLAHHQVPMIIQQVSTIPRLPNGKISRRTLSQSIQEAGTPVHTLGVST